MAIADGCTQNSVLLTVWPVYNVIHCRITVLVRRFVKYIHYQIVDQSRRRLFKRQLSCKRVKIKRLALMNKAMAEFSANLLTPCVFRLRLKTYLFHKCCPRWTFSSLGTDATDGIISSEHIRFYFSVMTFILGYCFLFLDYVGDCLVDTACIVCGAGSM